MLIIKRKHGYGARRKYIQGEGFVDSLTTSLKNIGSYVYQNKDLIAKPLLGAVGNLAATGLEEGTKALLKHIINNSNKSKPLQNNQNTIVTNFSQLDPKSEQILQNIMGASDIPVGNILGSGIKKF
jgi:hypothetical protein